MCTKIWKLTMKYCAFCIILTGSLDTWKRSAPAAGLPASLPDLLTGSIRTGSAYMIIGPDTMPHGSPDGIPDHGTPAGSPPDCMTECVTKPAGVRIHVPVIVPASECLPYDLTRSDRITYLPTVGWGDSRWLGGVLPLRPTFPQKAPHHPGCPGKE